MFIETVVSLWAVVFILSAIASFVEVLITRRRPIFGILAVAVAFAILGFKGKSGLGDVFWESVAVLTTLIVPLMIVKIIGDIVYNKYDDKRKEREKMLQHQALVRAYNESRKSLIQKYGEPTKTIHLEDYDITKDVDIFEEKQIIKLGDIVLPFKEINEHSILTETEIKKGKQYIYGSFSGIGTGMSMGVHGSHSQFNTGSGFISGSFNGTVESDNDHVLHDYFICISTHDIKQPVIVFEAGANQLQVKEIDEILKIIESRNVIPNHI